MFYFSPDQEKSQLKIIPTPKNEVGKTKLAVRYLYLKTYRKPSEQLFPNRRSLSYSNKNMKTYMNSTP